MQTNSTIFGHIKTAWKVFCLKGPSRTQNTQHRVNPKKYPSKQYRGRWHNSSKIWWWMHRVWHEKLIYVEWQWWSWISAAALGTGALAGVRMSRNTYLEVPQQPQCRVELHTSHTHYLWQQKFFCKKKSLACLLQIRLSSTIFSARNQFLEPTTFL